MAVIFTKADDGLAWGVMDAREIIDFEQVGGSGKSAGVAVTLNLGERGGIKRVVVSDAFETVRSKAEASAGKLRGKTPARYVEGGADDEAPEKETPSQAGEAQTGARPAEIARGQQLNAAGAGTGAGTGAGRRGR